jgi:hypothetical protein
MRAIDIQTNMLVQKPEHKPHTRNKQTNKQKGNIDLYLKTVKSGVKDGTTQTGQFCYHLTSSMC